MSSPIFTEEQTKNLFDGWAIIGVSIRSKDSFYFLLREMQKEDEPTMPDIDYKTRCVGYFGFLSASESKVRSFDIEYFNRPRIATHFNDATQVVVVKANGEAYANGAGQRGMEEVYPGFSLNINRVKSLLGDVYAVGTNREVYRRVGIDKWEDLRIGIPRPVSRDDWRQTGFKDISAFDNGDMYAVGGKGDVWRFPNGNETWVQCAFASNTALFNIVCASDGEVYIGAEGGAIYKGKEDVWTKICHETRTEPYNDLVWFQGQLCASSDYGFYRLVDGVMTRSDSEPYLGHMDVRDGCLLIAGWNSAWLHNGENWEVLLHSNNG